MPDRGEPCVVSLQLWHVPSAEGFSLGIETHPRSPLLARLACKWPTFVVHRVMQCGVQWPARGHRRTSAGWPLPLPLLHFHAGHAMTLTCVGLAGRSGCGQLQKPPATHLLNQADPLYVPVLIYWPVALVSQGLNSPASWLNIAANGPRNWVVESMQHFLAVERKLQNTTQRNMEIWGLVSGDYFKIDC